MSSNDRLGRNQRRAIAALLDRKSITEAAQACGLSDKTLQRYMAEPVFRAALLEAEGEAIDNAARLLIGLQTPAIRTITWAMADQGNTPGVRLRAAQAVLDYLLKLRELRNVEERLAALEAKVYETKY